MSNKFLKGLLLTAASLLPLAQAQAHTSSVGYENAGPGAITFWYGTYHEDATEITPITFEGSFKLVGLDVVYAEVVVPFTVLTATKPTGLVDGTTNFYSNGTILVGTNSGQTIHTWQGVSFTGLSAGTYRFTYIPDTPPSATWQPINAAILSSEVTLTAADIGGAPPASEPTIIDSSQGSFSENDAAANGSDITFGGGTFAPSTSISLDKPVNLQAEGGVIDTTQGDLAFTNVVAGSGDLTKTGTGQLTLSGPNTYTGQTILQGGTLNANAPNALGSGALVGQGGALRLGQDGALPQNIVLDNGGLVIDTAGHNIVASGGMSGAGSFTKTGEGTLNYTGAANSNGSIDVNGGRLAMNGSASGSTVTINDGGTLGGNGSIGGLIVKNKATAAPGNSIGKLTVGTFVVFEKGATYAVEVNAAGANDRIDVTGTATLEGGTVSVLAETGEYQPLTTYTILNAGAGVTGKFEGVTSNLAFLSPELSYGANAVTLTLVRNDLAFSGVARTANQRAVGRAVDSAFEYPGAVYDALLRGTADEGRYAFDQMSGEVYAGAYSTAITDGEIIRNAVLDRLSSPAEPPVDGRAVSAWATAYGAWGKVDGDGNAAKLDRDSQGVLMGMEAANPEGLRLGVAVGIGQGSADVDARRSSSETNTAQVLAYGSTKVGGFALRGGLGYAELSIDTLRTVAIRNFSETLSGKVDGQVTQAFAEVGYTFPMDRMSIEPVAGVATVRLKADGFNETGGVTALTGRSTSIDTTFTTLGVRGEGAFGADGGLKLKVGAAWRHNLDNDEPLANLAFQAGGPGFQTMAAAIDKNALALDAGLDWQVNGKLSLGAAYQGALGDTSQDHMMKANLSLKF